jgi:ADP-ribosylglycohydrolase
MYKNPLAESVLGVAIGDALGVPVEFLTRKRLRANPVTGIQEFGTHKQPRGTWSDDTSMVLCTVEELEGDFSIESLGERFLQWYRHKHWTPHGEIFDIGITTRKSLINIIKQKRQDLMMSFLMEMVL